MERGGNAKMITIIDVCKDRLHYLEFVKPIVDIVRNLGMEFEIIELEDLNGKVKGNKMIICGTSLIDFDYLNYWQKLLFLKDFDKPVLGICAGMQLLCKIYEGKLKESKFIGMNKKKLNKEFLGIKGEKEVYELHGKVCEFGNDWEKIDKDGECVYHRAREKYGVLFHPEVRNKEMIKRFVEL